MIKPIFSLGEPLTRRELQVLASVERGYSNSEIARLDFVSEDTIKFHLKNIYGKLGVSRRTQAVAAARGLGLLKEMHESKVEE